MKQPPDFITKSTEPADINIRAIETLKFYMHELRNLHHGLRNNETKSRIVEEYERTHKFIKKWS